MNLMINGIESMRDTGGELLRVKSQFTDVMAIATSRAGRNLVAVGSDDERSQGGRHVPNDAPTVPSSVLD